MLILNWIITKNNLVINNFNIQINMSLFLFFYINKNFNLVLKQSFAPINDIKYDII